MFSQFCSRVGQRVGVLSVLALTVFLSGCGRMPDVWPDKPGKRVMVTFVPLYSFASKVAGDDAVVACLLDNASPHEYQATPADAAKLNKADIFFINGLDLDENAANLLVSSARNPKLKVVPVGEAKTLKSQLRKMGKENEPGHEGHSHGEIDPHIWLGLPQAILMVEAIADELSALDPEHEKNYKANAAKYTEELKKILKDGKEALAKKKEKKIISFHDSLSYFADALGLEVVDTIQPTPGEEPSSSKLAKLVERCKKENIRVIAVEPNQVANTAATALKKELKNRGVDTEIVEIDMLESAPRAEITPNRYAEKMKANIDALVKAMK